MELQPLTCVRDCVLLRSVGCLQCPCTWWNSCLLITDVPDLVQIAVVSPMGNSDHSSLSAVVSMAQEVIQFVVQYRTYSGVT